MGRDIGGRRRQPGRQTEPAGGVAHRPVADEPSGEADDRTNGLLVERLAHGAQSSRETIGNLFGIGCQEDDGGPELADQSVRDLRARHPVQQVHIDQGKVGAFTLRDGEGAGAVHRATDDVAPGFAKHEFKLHRKDGLILDDHDPQVAGVIQRIPQPIPMRKVTVSVTEHFKRPLCELVLVSYENFPFQCAGGRMTADAEIRIADLERRLSGSYQLLQALVGIRLRSVQDPESQRHLTWLSDVVAAIGLVHRRMAATGPTDFASYLDDAVGFWRRACEDRPIRIDVRASSMALPETHAVPLAIILHELMSNAVRHAFPHEERGSIAVAYSRASDGVSLVVRDSGVGAVRIRNGDGLALVEGLVAHLGGSITIETLPGAGVGVRIRLPIRSDRPH